MRPREPHTDPISKDATERPRRNLTDQALRGFGWIASASGAQSLLQLGVILVLARLITPAEFGVVNAALIVIGLLTVLSQFGLAPALVHQSDLGEPHIRSAMGFSLLLASTIGLGVWLLSPVVAALYRSPEGFIPALRALTALFVLDAFSVVPHAMLQRRLEYRALAMRVFAAYLLGYGLVGISLALAGRGVWALVIASLATSATKMLVLTVAYGRVVPPSLRWKPLRQVLQYGGGFTLAKVANYSALQGDNFVVGRWLGMAELGLYGRAFQLMVAPAALVGGVVDQVLFPAMSVVQQEKEVLARAFRRATAGLALLVLPLSVLLVALAPEIILVVFGPDWTGAIAPFQVLTVGLLFRTSYKVSDSLSRAIGTVYSRAWRQWVYAGTLLFGAWLGARVNGVSGVAAGVVIAITLNFLLMTQLTIRTLPLHWLTLVHAHVPAVLVAGVVGAAAVPLGQACRQNGLPALLVLFFTGAGVTIAVAAAVLLSRQRILGQDGRWAVNAIAGAVRRAVHV